jgi:sugar phosphate isomerase/epimerase
MKRIRVGCQTYTWEMLGKKWKGSVDDMLDIISGAGYEGVELTNTMIGSYYDRPDDFARALEKRGLAFPSFGFVPVRSFTDPAKIEDEMEYARKGIDFVARFPGCRLDLAGGSAAGSAGRENLDRKFQTMCRFYNEVAALADRKNVAVDVHPHSHAGSIIEKADEYQHLMENTDPSLVGWCPDSGHIVRGGLDLLATLRKYQARIRNFHFKDADAKGNWALLGKGVCDFATVLRFLEEIGYAGWIVAEEESEEAEKDQRGAVSKNREFLKSLGY